MKATLGRESLNITKPEAAPFRLGVSSQGLGWNGFSVLEFFGDPGERPEREYNYHIFGLCRGNIASGEQTTSRGRYVPYKRYPGMVTLIPPAVMRRNIAFTPHDVALCLLEPAFVEGVAEEMDRRPIAELRFRANVNDPPMRQFISLLVAEASQGGPLGRLYADHVAHALAARLFVAVPNGGRTVCLPPHVMRRVLERMHNLGAELDLQTLAAETGYSRAHFLRMFRATTGVPPHQYILQLRVERAKELIRLPYASLIDVAAACGFSSHAHLSRVFRQLVGMAPSEYRRNL